LAESESPHPPRTRDEALAWVVQQICEWRRDGDVPWKPDRSRLAIALDDLELRRNGQVAGIAEGLVVYIVLACEWLLRVGKIGPGDVEGMLVALEDALAERMAPELAFWVTEVLAKPLRDKVTKEGRKLLSLGTYLPMARPTLRQLFAPSEPMRRLPPDRIVPAARGRIPWPAPWVAGALVRELLNRRRVDLAQPALKLTQALFGHRQVKPAEFEAQTRGLTPSVLAWWVDVFEHRYGQRFAPAGTSPELWAAFYSDLTVLGPESVFPSDPDRTRELLLAYAAVRRLRGQKPGEHSRRKP